MLGVVPTRGGHVSGAGMPPGKQSAIGRFLLPVADCTFALEQVLADLQKDPWPCKQDERVQRCTGTALSVGLGLLESSVPRQGSRLMFFVAGPPTIGAGLIVGRAKTENIRSHNDLQKSQAPHNKAAVEFYKSLSDRAVANQTVVDAFACSLDQVGILEAKILISRSGGLIVLADSFGQSVFRESLRRVFERLPESSMPLGGGGGMVPNGSGQLHMGFGGNIEVLHSREYKIAGAIGPVASLKKVGPNVSETEIGVG